MKFCLHFIPIKLMDSFFFNLMITGPGCCSSVKVALLKGEMQWHAPRISDLIHALCLYL